MYLDVRPDELQYLPFSFCHLVLATSNCNAFRFTWCRTLASAFPTRLGTTIFLVGRGAVCLLAMPMRLGTQMLIKEPLRFKLYMRTNEITKNIYPPSKKCPLFLCFT